MAIFVPESSSPFLRILDENFILPDSNSIMKKKYSHSSHDEDDALRVPLEQVQKLLMELDKMCNWLLQENHNQDPIKAIEALKKFLCDN